MKRLILMGLLMVGLVSCHSQSTTRYQIDSATLTNMDTHEYRDIEYKGTATFWKEGDLAHMRVNNNNNHSGVHLIVKQVLAQKETLPDLGTYDALVAISPEEKLTYGVILTYDFDNHLIGISLLQGSRLLLLYIVPRSGTAK